MKWSTASIHVLLAAAALLLLAGCSAYERADRRFDAPDAPITLVLPAGWMRYKPAHPETVLTKNGLRLQRITIRVTPLGAPLPKTRRVYHERLTPPELAELALSLIAADPSFRQFEVLSIEAARIADRDACRADAAYVDPDGLPKRLRLYGVLVGQSVCELRFDAAETVYFDRDLPAFEQAVASARTR